MRVVSLNPKVDDERAVFVCLEGPLSVAVVRDPAAAEGESRSYRLVFERLGRNGGWYELFAIREERLEQLRSLADEAADYLAKHAARGPIAYGTDDGATEEFIDSDS